MDAHKRILSLKLVRLSKHWQRNVLHFWPVCLSYGALIGCVLCLIYFTFASQHPYSVFSMSMALFLVHYITKEHICDD